MYLQKQSGSFDSHSKRCERQGSRGKPRANHLPVKLALRILSNRIVVNSKQARSARNKSRVANQAAHLGHTLTAKATAETLETSDDDEQCFLIEKQTWSSRKSEGDHRYRCGQKRMR
jgi:hypothetical protein